jgi:glutamate dehydrogenase
MNKTKDIRQSIINSVIELLSKKESSETLINLKVILNHYCHDENITELRRQTTEDRCGSILCLWQIMHNIEKNRFKIRVYNTNPHEHNWYSTHSVIEIISEDTPFLLSSILLELNNRDLQVYSLFHPVINVKRSKTGKLISIKEKNNNTKDANYSPEVLIRIEIDKQNDTEELSKIKSAIANVINEVYQVVDDWNNMRAKLIEASEWYKSTLVASKENERTKENIDFLKWIADDNFLFLGFKYSNIIKEKNKYIFKDDETSTLGLLCEKLQNCLNNQNSYYLLKSNEKNNSILAISKSTNKSTIHRPGYLDYIGVKKLNNQGEIIGEWQFWGLFSSVAYNTPIDRIPLVRKKVIKILESTNYAPRSHQGQALKHLLNNYPRDELLQADITDLQLAMKGIIESQERKRLKVVARKDNYCKFISVVLYIPRDKFNTELRVGINDILLKEFMGDSTDFSVKLTESLLAQLHFIVHSENVKNLKIDTERLEELINEKMLTWNDHLNKAFLEIFGEATGSKLRRKYSQSFPEAYKEDVNPRQAIMDITKFESLVGKDDINTTICRPISDFNYWQFRVAGTGKMFALSDVLPILDKIGVRVINARSYSINPKITKNNYWLINFVIELADENCLNDKYVRDQLHQVFVRTWKQQIQNDGFNAFVLLCGLSWKQIVIIRALAKYLLQLQVPFSQSYMQKVLKANSNATKTIIDLFEIKFDPNITEDRNTKIASAKDKIQKILDDIENLDEDRILRYFISVVDATVRTNAYKQQGDKSEFKYLSFKIKPTDIPISPLPRPMFEIFVYSPYFEGIHMRSSKVARGGIRWSDRREDFRTEILGLVKAQMIKNAVIVPHGAKGGFVLKKPTTAMNRDEILEEGIKRYKQFISGLLDLTDNLIDGKIISDQHLVKYDDDDPYLVVAADKGTATFSDIANEISLSYNFWLGDAFASGGSQGYDHKKMGITARGAWESVKCLFMEIDINTQKQNISVVGIGDMSGDVFGNGMLLSKTIKLIAAFNHRHIFIDPNPDAATSYQERKRLFEMPRSSWDNYDKKLISKGGGIYSRQSKKIELSTEAKKVLQITSDFLTPNEVIQAILKAPVDLLWNGGIGTYIKSSTEDNADVGDVANDSLRINAKDINAKVVGEGGNLGLTQKSRIEFAKNKGLINTDAVDNSAGVDCSDHEVNIKILLNEVVRNGDYTLKQRNKLLVKMTEEVGNLVLEHNRLQILRLSLSRFQNLYYFNDHRFMIRDLENEGRLNRTLDCLPEDAELKTLGKTAQGLTQPEISILLSHVKMELSEDLAKHDITNMPILSEKLTEYFPKPIREQFSKNIYSHPLKNEILGTHVANEVCNRMGAAFVYRLQHETRATKIDCVRAYLAVIEILSIKNIWNELESLGNKVAFSVYAAELFRIQRQIEKSCIWLLGQMERMDINQLITLYKPSVQQVAKLLPELLGENDCERLDVWSGELQAAGVPSKLASYCAGLRYLYYSFFITQIADTCDVSIECAAHIFFALEDKLSLAWVREIVRHLPVSDLWKRKAVSALHSQIDRALAKNCISILRSTSEKNITQQLEHWEHTNKDRLKIWNSTIAEVKSSSEKNFSMMSVAIQELAMLSRD